MTLEQVQNLRGIFEENDLSYKVMIDNGAIAYSFSKKVENMKRPSLIWNDDKQMLIFTVTTDDQWLKRAAEYNTRIVPYEWIEWMEIIGSLTETIKAVEALGATGEQLATFKEELQNIHVC